MHLIVEFDGCFMVSKWSFSSRAHQESEWNTFCCKKIDQGLIFGSMFFIWEWNLNDMVDSLVCR